MTASVQAIGKKKHPVRRWVLLALLVLLVAGLAVIGTYLMTYSPADDPAVAALSTDSGDGVQVMRQDGLIVFRPTPQSALPEGAQRMELPGGNHAQFGSYGIQKGDGTADVTPLTQWEWSAGLVTEFLTKLDK